MEYFGIKPVFRVYTLQHVCLELTDCIPIISWISNILSHLATMMLFASITDTWADMYTFVYCILVLTDFCNSNSCNLHNNHTSVNMLGI